MFLTSSGIEQDIHTKKIKILGVRVYTINGRDTIYKLGDVSHCGYSMEYVDTTGVILYWKLDQLFVTDIDHHVWFYEYNSLLSIKTSTLQVFYQFNKIPKVLFISQNSST